MTQEAGSNGVERRGTRPALILLRERCVCIYCTLSVPVLFSKVSVYPEVFQKRKHIKGLHFILKYKKKKMQRIFHTTRKSTVILMR